MGREWLPGFAPRAVEHGADHSGQSLQVLPSSRSALKQFFNLACYRSDRVKNEEVRVLGTVIKLYPGEAVRVDDQGLHRFLAGRGDPEASRALARTLDEMAVRLSRIENAYDAGAIERVEKGARGLAALADQTGFRTLRAAAIAVAELSRSRDSTALAACVARLIRVGEMSLVTVGDVHGISL